MAQARELPERERTIDRLCEAFADDRLALDDFERRVALAHAATSPAELDGLLADLRRPTTSGAPQRVAEGTDERHPVPGGDRARVPTAPPHDLADQNVVVAFLGGGERRGPWTVARTNWAIAVMGGVELDLREAVLAPGVTEVNVFAFWGGVEIVVPPDVRVECSGVGIMGGFDHEQTARSTDDPDAPVVRIGGWAVMGGIEVSVRRAGESSKQARRRRKAERKAERRALEGPRRELPDPRHGSGRGPGPGGRRGPS